MRLSIENIQKKSEELDVPFRNLLPGILLEMTAARLFQGSFSRSLCIENAQELSVSVYRKKPPLRLELFYFLRSRTTEGVTAGRPIDGEVLGLMASELFPKADRDGLSWKTRLGEAAIYATGLLEKYEVPIELRLREVPEAAFICVPRELSFSFDTGRSALVMAYPLELYLADRLAQILEKLELLCDLSPYLEVYEVLQREGVSGREVQNQLVLRCGSLGVDLLPGRLDIIRGYGEYRFMQKKWKSLLRVRKIKEPAWEEALSAVTGFLGPIWESSCRQEIFFEDWMPELGRFM